MFIMEKKFCNVNGYSMAYVESGDDTADPIVFLHGNPTSSFLWRNVMAPLESLGRLIAPDLIGMGDSDKLNSSGVDSYTFLQHADFLDGLLECVGVSENVTLVIHDWGSALGFWWARRNPNAVKGIAYMEALVASLLSTELPVGFDEFLLALRTNGTGETMILEQNLFIESALPSGIVRNLTEAEMNVYRAPYLEPGESRRPTLTWPRELPIDGQPADTHAVYVNYSDWMATTEFPKLFINADPGVLLVGSYRDYVRTWKNQQEVTVGPAIHFIQEDKPEEIAEAIETWLMDVVLVAAPATSAAPAVLNPSASVWSIIVLGMLCRFFRFTAS